MAVCAQRLAVLYCIFSSLAEFYDVVDVHGFRVQEFLADGALVLLPKGDFPPVFFGDVSFGFECSLHAFDDLQLLVGAGVFEPLQEFQHGGFGHPGTVDVDVSGKLFEVEAQCAGLYLTECVLHRLPVVPQCPVFPYTCKFRCHWCCGWVFKYVGAI